MRLKSLPIARASKIPRALELAFFLAFAFAIMMPGLGITQTVSSGTTQRPVLAPGEKLSGKDHPELIPRRVAFLALLDLLSVQPEDALYRQRRARTIESTRIGLGVEDASQLEQIVETYRSQERALNYKTAQLRTSSVSSHQDLLLQKQQHLVLLREAYTAINHRLTKEGRANINSFLDEIISKSEIHSAAISPITGARR